MALNMDCTYLVPSTTVPLEERKVMVVSVMEIPPPVWDPDFLTNFIPYPGGTWVVEWCDQHESNYVYADNVTPMGTKIRMIWGCGNDLVFYEL